MIVGFVGFGEAASSMAAGLREEGVEEILCFDSMQSSPLFADAIRHRCEACGAQQMESAIQVCQRADIVFSAVPSQFALSAAQSAVDGASEGCLYVDVSTATPGEKRRMAALFEEKGALFTDGAMLGALLKDRHKVPMLLSGNGAAKVKAMMEPFHMRMDLVEGEPGQATRIKFIRSITAKGISCLLFESLQAAQRFGVENTIVESLLDSFGPQFLGIINGYVSGAIVHAERREHEMENVEDFLKEEGLPYLMTEATRAKLAWIKEIGVKGNFDGPVPRDWKGVLSGWKLNTEATADPKESACK